MGPISPYGPKEFGRLTEQDIFNESQKFMTEQQLCQKTDEIFLTLRRVIADINIYGQRHLLDHVRHIADRQKKIQFLLHWRTLQLEHLDVLFQNLIRKKILRIDEEQHFKKVDLVDKYRHPEGKRLWQRGEELLRQGKVAVLLFIGCTAGKGEEGFSREFHKAKPTDSSIFQILMNRLEKTADAYGCPPIYLFHNAQFKSKISQFLKEFRYADRVQLCQQSTHPILNLNGNVCLRANDQPDVVEMPCGSADFHTAVIQGENILDRLKREGVEFAACADGENILEAVVDPFLVGLAAEEQHEVVYKVAYPFEVKDKIFRRVVLQNGVPRADTLLTLNSFVNYNHKYRANNSQNVCNSPVWTGSLLFSIAALVSVLNSGKKPETFPQAVNYIMRNLSYWSPIDCVVHNQQSCYVFQRQVSDLFINNSFKGRAVLVERDEEYLPILTEKKEYSWEKAYEEYNKKKARGPILPFWERYQEELKAKKEKEQLEKIAKEKEETEKKVVIAETTKEKLETQVEVTKAESPSVDTKVEPAQQGSGSG